MKLDTVPGSLRISLWLEFSFEPGSSAGDRLGQQAPFYPVTSILKATCDPPTSVKSQCLCSSIFSFQQTAANRQDFRNVSTL